MQRRKTQILYVITSYTLNLCYLEGFMGTGTKTLIALGLGVALGISPLRDSALVEILIAISGG